MMIPKAPILSWRSEDYPGDSPTIKIACPLCGNTHEHGAGAGPRTAHCMVNWRPKRSYEIRDEDFARRRYLSGDWSIAVNPYRTDRELVRQMRKTLGWQRVPAERLEKVFGEWLYQRVDVGEIRALSPAEFDTWLRGNGFMDFIRDRCFTERRIIYLFQLKEVFAALRKPIRDELQKAAAAWFKRGME
jgi:hypothetical protein